MMSHRPHAARSEHFETLEPRRLMSAGGLDTTFASGGVLNATVGGGLNPVSTDANPNAVLPDGSIVATFAQPFHGNRYGFTIAHFRPDGSRDESFGAAGSDGLIRQLEPHSISSRPVGVVSHPDGGFLVL